jgi:hypothetical protein
MQVPVEQIPESRIEQTWLDGALVFKRMYK